MRFQEHPPTTSTVCSPPVAATSRTLFVSMARRHPDGHDAEYLRWHTLDHRPEQHRLAGRARVAAAGVDAGLPGRTGAQRRALRRDRPRDDLLLHRPERADGVPRAVHGAWRRRPEAAAAAAGAARCLRGGAARRRRRGSRSAPTCCRGGRPRACTCCWSAARRRRRISLDVDGVGGVWSVASQAVDARLASAPAGQLLTYCFLDDDPVATAERLRPALADAVERRRRRTAARRAVLPGRALQWDRYVP